ncbi:MAG: hypothetical protein ABEL04_14155 [Salinibacter sp.]|uniref:hypothetical protein n=1 Tax=Salinibacter sp. TaxID=2065818 RepID=UPI0035D529E1
MSTPSAAENEGRDDIPAWMKTIDEETFYCSDSSSANETPSPSTSHDSPDRSSPVDSSAEPPPAGPSKEARPEYMNSADDASSSLHSSSDPAGDSPPADASEDQGTEVSKMPLHRKLSMSMGDPSGLPEPNPDLQPEVLGYVRAGLNKRVEEAVSVLDTRYGSGFSKSLLLDVALRQILTDLHTHGEDCTLVLWLDSILQG